MAPQAWVAAILSWGIGLGASVAAAAPETRPAYRTVVIFGDTQSMMNDFAPDQYADFTSMIDWVIANKHQENIDFVLHVGDVIDLGALMPLPERCQGAPVASLETCRRSGCASSRDGCFTNAGGACSSCSLARELVRAQWARFNSQWSRLEPDPESRWMGLPNAIVRGNHDNVGVDPEGDLDVRGYAHYYGEAHFEALERAFAGGDRHYEHLETFPHETRDGHAWRFRLGNRPVLIVAPSYQAGRGTSSAQIDWVRDVFGRFPGTPAVLLVHDMMEHWQLYHRVVLKMPEVAPRLFMTVQGHAGRDEKSIDDIEGYQVLRTVNDWSRRPSPGGSYLSLVRFYFDPDGVDRVEALSYSPVLGAEVIGEKSTIRIQPFGIDQDPDHDCLENPSDPDPFVRNPNPSCEPVRPAS